MEGIQEVLSSFEECSAERAQPAGHFSLVVGCWWAMGSFGDHHRLFLTAGRRVRVHRFLWCSLGDRRNGSV